MSNTTIAPINAELSAFVDAVLLLDENDLLAATIAQAKAEVAERKVTTTIAKAKPATVKPVKTVDPAVGSGKSQATALNWAGQRMLSGRGTASAGQRKWLKANGVKANVIAIVSMVKASDMRAEMTGKLA